MNKNSNLKLDDDSLALAIDQTKRAFIFDLEKVIKSRISNSRIGQMCPMEDQI